jgi:hypothetical protein
MKPDIRSEPAATIRARLDAGFSAVQAGNMRRQMGASGAGADMQAFVERIVAEVRALAPAANFSESQQIVVNKKIQALQDAANRISNPR